MINKGVGCVKFHMSNNAFNYFYYDIIYFF